MTLWTVQLPLARDMTVAAGHCEVEHNSLVFRETASGVVQMAFAPDQWKSVAIVPEAPATRADIFGAATRDIVQG